ncbi:MAG: class I SAM-dependent methyltransferase [Pseudomonadota bacterium]
MVTIILKPGRDRSLQRHHPWIFSGAIREIRGSPKAGESVAVISADGTWLATGAYSPHSQIAVRIWSFHQDEDVSAYFFYSRLEKALQFRASAITNMHLTASRLVNAESDGLPGIIVDRYSEFLVCQFLTAGAEYWKSQIIQALIKLAPCKGIYERSDVVVREKEGLTKTTGVLYGEKPPEFIEIKEGPVRFLVNIKEGHKTGFYLDQRENRMALAHYCEGKEVLNCFSYTGGFGVWALKGGASCVVNVDSSAQALQLGEKNFELNSQTSMHIENVESDVFKAMRQFRESNRRFDIIVLDPPKFAQSRYQLKQASRGYKDINRLAFLLLRPGGLLFTFSCSSHMGAELFQKVVADAALDAGCDAQILDRFVQAPDHPIGLNFPEGNYLKGLLIRVW